LGTRITLLRPGLIPYHDAWGLQRRIADEVRAGAPETLILLEHPPTYTLGARGRTSSVLSTDAALRARGADVVQSDRGGDVTFHGPGQLVAYPILNLHARNRGPAWYVHALEDVLIDALSSFGADAGRSEGRPGVWCGADKIAAIGVRVSRGVTLHGFALNVDPDLSFFDHIVPCGLVGVGVTSMRIITGRDLAMRDVEDAVVASFERHFDATIATPAGGLVGS
jgi:lipoate-protein ligase B